MQPLLVLWLVLLSGVGGVDALPITAPLVVLLAGKSRWSRQSRQTMIVHAPGSRLDAWLRFLCSRKTMERVFDPYLADMREEYFNALAAGRRGKARWVLLTYYWGFAKMLPLFALMLTAKQVAGLRKLLASTK